MVDAVLTLPSNGFILRCRRAMDNQRQAEAAGDRAQSCMFTGQIDTLRALWEIGTGKDDLCELAQQ